MAKDYAIVQQQTVGNKTLNYYITKSGNIATCFADSSISCGRTFENVENARIELTKRFTGQSFILVSDDFIDKENI